MAHHSSDLATRPAAGPMKPVKPRGQRHDTKSLPFDPEDLRRRLHVVIAEQNAQKDGGGKRRSKADAAGGRKAKEEQSKAAKAKPAGAARSGAAPAADSATSDANTPTVPETLNLVQKTLSRLGRAKSPNAPSQPAKQAPKPKAPEEPYHHVPQAAADAFKETATANVMRESSDASRLSTQAPATDKAGLDAGKDAGEQQRVIRRAQSQRERLHGHNRFQSPGREAQTRAPRDPTQRHTLPASLPPPASALKRFSLGSLVAKEFDQADRRASGHSSSNASSGDEGPSATHVDSAAAPAPPQPRADWTQSDEPATATAPSEKPKSSRSPLLRRPDSIMALKAKLGGLTRVGRDEKTGSHSAVTVERVEDVSPLSAAPNTTTTATTNNNTVKTPKLGFFSRFKR